MLAGKGFPLSPLITFLVASSSLNPQLFFITLGGINAEMALVRLITVIIFSVLMGLIVRYLPEASILSVNKKNNPGVRHVAVPEKGKGFRLSVKSMWKDLKYIGFFILLGCLIGAVIEVFVPADRISTLFGAGPAGSVFIASILGIPVYVCGGGTIPVIGSLLSKGLNEGAALSFLTVGQAVRITPLMALASLIKIRYLIYLVCAIIIYAIFIGYTYQIMT